MTTSRKFVVRVAQLSRTVLPVSYLCILLAGIAAIVAPPTSISSSTSSILSVAWGIMLVVGALLGLAGTVGERPGIELLGSPLLFMSIFTYGVVLLIRQWSVPGIASNGTVAAWIIIALSISGILYRFVQLYLLAQRWENRLQ